MVAYFQSPMLARHSRMFEEILKREHVWFLWTETPLTLESCT